jgi:hypothetical protein
MTAIGFAHGVDLGNGFAHSPELNAASIGAIAADAVPRAVLREIHKSRLVDQRPL